MDLSRTVGRATCRSRLGIRIGAIGAMLAAVVLVGPLRQGMPTASANVLKEEAGRQDPAGEPKQAGKVEPAPTQKKASRPVPEKADDLGPRVGEDDPQQQGDQPLPVDVVKVQKGDRQEEVVTPCTLEAREKARVDAEFKTTGDRIEMEVKLGAAVKKGQRLFLCRGADNAEGAEGTSPIDGIVTQVPNNRHRSVEVTDASEIVVTTQVPENFVPRIHRGQTARVAVTGFEQEFTAKVTVPPLAIDAATRTATVQLVIPNPEGKLLPGMSGRARFQGELLRGVLLVPSLACWLDTDPNEMLNERHWLLYRVRVGKEGKPVRTESTVIRIGKLLPQEAVAMPGQHLEEGDLLLAHFTEDGTDRPPVSPFVLHNMLGGRFDRVEIRLLDPDEARLRGQKQRSDGFPFSGGMMGGSSGGGFR